MGRRGVGARAGRRRRVLRLPDATSAAAPSAVERVERRSRARCSRCRRATTRASPPTTTPRSTQALTGCGCRARDRRLRRRTAQLLRPQAGGVRRRVRRMRGDACSRSSSARVILAIDQGTTGTTCLVVDDELRVLGRGYRELPQHFPRPGWVEHDPEEIWASVLARRRRRARRGGRRARRARGDRDHQPARDDAAVGARDRAAGRPGDRLAGPAHGRPLPRARRRADPRAHRARPDPYFSATKLEWLLASTDRATGSRSARSTAGSSGS